MKTTKSVNKNQGAIKSSNVILSSSTSNTKMVSKQPSLGSADASQKLEAQTQQQPILFTSSGELGNVVFLQQTVDDQTGNVITTSLPMMTTSDGTTVVQVISSSIISYLVS